jgi:hypothetical protein
MTNLDILSNSPAIRAADFLAQHLLKPTAPPKQPALVKALQLVEADVMAGKTWEFVAGRDRDRAEHYLEKAEDLTDSPIADDIEKDDAIDAIEADLRAAIQAAVKDDDHLTLRALAKQALEDRI